MTEAEVFRNVLSWNGFVGWDHLIKDWIKNMQLTLMNLRSEIEIKQGR